MLNKFDFLRELGHKIKGDGIQNADFEGGRNCRAVMLQLPKSRPIDIEFKDITYTVKVKKENKTVIKGISGTFKSGELTAIMGPSGAGKSSLLNILTGFQTTGTTGSMSNSKSGTKISSQFKKESCYILQDDQLFPYFTVGEVMKIAADLKLGNNLSLIAKQMVINEVLVTLGLSNTKDTKCGRLSGGQKKRLSIALELIDNPPVMFLDEPTTGLDSSSSAQCIGMLKNLAKGGRTIVCTIHQPSASVYELFDHVYIMAEGMCIYQGASSNTVSYLKTFGLECPKYHNPADYILEIANCEYGNFNKDLAKKSSDSRWRTPIEDETSLLESPVVISKTLIKADKPQRPSLAETCKATVLITPPSEISKFAVLLNRTIVQLCRDWTVTYFKALVHCVTGIILGLTFSDSGSDGSKSISNIGFLLIGIVYLGYTSMMPAVLRFPQELLILKKENFNNWYKLKTYYLAIIVCNVPVQIIFATVYSVSSYFLSHQPLELWRFSMFLTTLILVVLISEAIGHIIGTLVDAINGTFWASILTCACLVYAGFLVLFPHMSQVMYAISYISYYRYALEAMMISIYGYDRPPLECPEDVLYCHLKHPAKVLQEVSMENVNYWYNILILLAITVVLKVVAFFFLRRNLRKS